MNTSFRIRPITPDDAPALQSFARGLSWETKRLRFNEWLKELPPDMLKRFTHTDHRHDAALIALQGKTIIGVARYFRIGQSDACEFAIVIADKMQRQGVGTSLMEQLIHTARERGMRRIFGLVLDENIPMLKLMKRLHFTVENYADDRSYEICSLELT